VLVEESYCIRTLKVELMIWQEGVLGAKESCRNWKWWVGGTSTYHPQDDDTFSGVRLKVKIREREKRDGRRTLKDGDGKNGEICIQL
jgi:hypothetical protein